MPDKLNPIRETDDQARALARDLIKGARHGALGVIDSATGVPSVTRIAVVPGPDGTPMTLISELSQHTAALRANQACSLLVGEPGAKGDPLSHPRLTLQCRAAPVDKMAHRYHYLEHYPKAQLYFDFGDFHLFRLGIEGAALNGGFGKAYLLTPEDFTG